MKRLMLAVMLAATPLPAMAQQVEIQGLIVTVKQGRTEVTSQQAGTQVGDHYSPVFWSFNQPMPFIPARWFCLTDFETTIYGAGAQNVDGRGAYISFFHDIDGHQYHGLTSPLSTRMTPMAFRPGDPTALRLQNVSGGRVYARVRIAGYYGADETVTDPMGACQ